jgi:hypothetical protein
LKRLADGFTLVADMKFCLGQQPLDAKVSNISVVVMPRLICVAKYEKDTEERKGNPEVQMYADK